MNIYRRRPFTRIRRLFVKRRIELTKMSGKTKVVLRLPKLQKDDNLNITKTIEPES
jgi:hypothetical protein